MHSKHLAIDDSQLYDDVHTQEYSSSGESSTNHQLCEASCFHSNDMSEDRVLSLVSYIHTSDNENSALNSTVAEDTPS